MSTSGTPCLGSAKHHGHFAERTLPACCREGVPEKLWIN